VRGAMSKRGSSHFVVVLTAHIVSFYTFKFPNRGRIIYDEQDAEQFEHDKSKINFMGQ
jgi:hypothetical protein